MDALRSNVKLILRIKLQVSLFELLHHHEITKGMAEILGSMQVAAEDSKHYINNERTEKLDSIFHLQCTNAILVANIFRKFLYQSFSQFAYLY